MINAHTQVSSHCDTLCLCCAVLSGGTWGYYFAKVAFYAADICRTDKAPLGLLSTTGCSPNIYVKFVVANFRLLLLLFCNGCIISRAPPSLCAELEGSTTI